MRILIFSDIHANLSALTTVLDAAGQVDEYWLLGDLVGYGPDPNECVEIIRELPNLTYIMGNHDAAAVGLIDLAIFNQEAKFSALWTQKQLTTKNLVFLKNAPEKLIKNGITLAHGSPRNPVWEYILDPYTAGSNFNYFDTHLCMVGHTHIPTCYYPLNGNEKEYWSMIGPGESPDLLNRAILNPGSVGQPRDHDPRASYAIFNPEQNNWEIFRIEYDIICIQKRIINAGLPNYHALRLTQGW